MAALAQGCKSTFTLIYCVTPTLCLDAAVEVVQQSPEKIFLFFHGLPLTWLVTKKWAMQALSPTDCFAEDIDIFSKWLNLCNGMGEN